MAYTIINNDVVTYRCRRTKNIDDDDVKLCTSFCLIFAV